MAVKGSHMITRSYLEAWANERNSVYVLDAESNGRVQSVNRATVIKYGYRTEFTTLDLEQHYSRIESDGVLAFRALREGSVINTLGRKAVVHFLDMHLERGRYADQAKVKMPIVRGDFTTGEVQATTMGMGDRLVLSQSVNRDALRLSEFPLSDWRWHVVHADSLITGDGAVLLWTHGGDDNLIAVTFPISPTRLLAIGDIKHLFQFQLNDMVAFASRRWLVSRVSDVQGI